MESDSQPFQDWEFARRVKAAAGPEIERCYQCYTCGNACPVGEAMDFYPNELIYMARLGLKDKVLRSRTLWLCVSCESCASRCPNEIRIVDFMDVLRREAVTAGVKIRADAAAQFHEMFIREIQRHGRIHELGFLVGYAARAKRIFSGKSMYRQGLLGLKMFLKGRLPLFRNPSGKQEATGEIRRKIFREKGMTSE